MTVTPRLSSLGQEFCLVPWTTGYLTQGFYIQQGPNKCILKGWVNKLVFIKPLLYLYHLIWDMVSSILFVSSTMESRASCPAEAGFFQRLGWEKSFWKCQKLFCIPERNMVWPSVGSKVWETTWDIEIDVAVATVVRLQAQETRILGLTTPSFTLGQCLEGGPLAMMAPLSSKSSG